MRNRLIGLGLATLITSGSASSQVMTGAYVPGDGFDRSEIVNYNSVVPKSLAFVNIFSSFSHDWDHLYWQSSNVVSEGAMPLITWMPIDLSRPEANILSEIALGLHDAYLDEWAYKLAAWVAQYPIDQKPKILLRFGHEFNGNWYAYGNSPFFFQSAWQYIHDRFENAGVNKHVEWVWSANNVSVDDYDDITAYYPGSEYVDWTSIDGYNFGTNYTWTDWESFSSLYTNTYLTLVNNYPEKPVLIAEIGSAEETDIPDQRWGQFGDNSDASQSKETWISTFLTELEANYPAVRAIAWFNTNKELGWSLTDSSNTGITAWINGVQSDYYTTDFLSAAFDYPVNDLELAAREKQAQAEENYAIAKRNFEASEIRLVQIESDIQQEEASSQLELVQKEEALVQMTVARDEFLSVRVDYLELQQASVDSKQVFIAERTQANDRREAYLVNHGSYRSAVTKRHDAYLTFNEARRNFIDKRTQFQQAVKYYLGTREQYFSSQSTDSDSSPSREELNEALAEYLETRDTFLSVFSTFLEQSELYRSADESSQESLEKRLSALSRYRQKLDEMKIARDKYFTTIQKSGSKWNHLLSARDIFIDRINKHREIDEIYKEKSTSLIRLRQELSEAETLHQSRSAALMDAFTNVTNAEQQRSLFDESSSGGLMLSDSNSKKEEKVSKDKGDEKAESNGQKLVAHNNKKLTKKVKIDKVGQKALALSRKPDPIDPVKVKERQEKYKNMSQEEKEALSQQKLTVLQY